MDNIGLIGYTGFVGSIVRPFYKFNKFYNKNNVIDLPNNKFDLLICAAPTGNRLQVQNDPMNDLEMILFLIDHLRKTSFKKFVLISTIDTLAKPNTRYGMNRKILEWYVKSNLDNTSIIRMPTLIHPEIKKNILFDLKNKQWLEKVNLKSTAQYYNMSRLKADIDYTIEHNIKELNLFSEPISNQEIISRFFPELKIDLKSSTSQEYNVYPQKFTKEEIFLSMEKYFNEVPLHLW